jgi:hypothetical protein
MTPEMPDSREVQHRLDRLERQNRRLERALLVAMAAVGALVFLGLTGPQKGDASAQTVEAQKIILRDSRGRIRASLGASEAGGELVLYDADGDARVQLFTESDGSGLKFFDHAGKPRAGLAEGSKVAGLAFYNPEGKEQAEVAVDVDGPIVALSDKQESRRAVLRLEAEEPALTLYDADGRSRAALGDALEIFDGSGERRVFIHVNEGACAAACGPQINLLGTDGKARAIMVAPPGGPSRLVLTDSFGKPLWMVPPYSVAP